MEEKKKRPLTEKQKAAFERRRRKGYEIWLKEKHKEMAKREKEEKKRKERERIKREKERLRRQEEKKKRPVGRPKKRGPKKKKKKKIVRILKSPGRHALPPFNFKIISCRNGIQNKFIGRYRSSEDAYEVFNKLKENDKNVIFEARITGTYTLQNSIDEYILIEKKDAENTKLRNEYGKLVEQNVNKEGWIVLDKFRYKKEEEFWVWGYDKNKDRKTFAWIYENIILNNIFNNPYEFKRILIYKNKLVIKDDRGDIDLIICKDESDSIRFYNLLEKWTQKDKIKQIMYIGNYSAISKKRKQIEDELIELTGWKRKKIQMKNTIFNRKITVSNT